MAKKKTKKTTAKKVTKKKVAKSVKQQATKANSKPARRGLSRGLGALLGASRPNKEAAPIEMAVEVPIQSPQPTQPAASPSVVELANGQLTTLPIEQLQRGRYQPRQVMKQEPLEELAASIKQQGIMQPIVVREVSKHAYEIIAGERRWRAAQIAQLQDVPVIVRNIADEDAIAMALIENIQRENLNAIEEAMALHRLIEEFELTHEEAAKAVGRSRASVSNLLRLLDLEPRVREMLANEDISMGHARALLSLSAMQQLSVSKEVAKKGLSVRATEALVRSVLNPVTKPALVAKTKNADLQRLELDLTDRLGARVTIDDKKGKGKLVISYTSLDELDGILDKIR